VHGGKDGKTRHSKPTQPISSQHEQVGQILALTWDNIGRSKIPNEKKHGADHEDIKSGCPGVGPVLAGISAQQGIKRVKRT